MKSMTVTYHAPPGDSKVVEAFGHTFFDGKSEQIEVPEHTAEKLRGNRHFQCSDSQDAKPKQDAKATKADEDAAKRADEAKTAAQLPNPPQRGAVLNPPEAEQPPFPDGEKGEAKGEAHHDKHEAHKAKT
jgi:hypothetical protein